MDYITKSNLVIEVDKKKENKGAILSYDNAFSAEKVRQRKEKKNARV